MSKKSLTPIEAGENVLRQTIQMINSELRGAIKEYNRRAGSSWQKWDYNEVFSQIAGCFAGTDMAVRAAEVDKKPLYTRPRRRKVSLSTLGCRRNKVCRNRATAPPIPRPLPQERVGVHRQS